MVKNPRQKEKKERLENMDGEEIEGVVRRIPDFGGVFDASKMDRVKILSLPIMLIININNHWLGLRIEKSKLEIMDSLGNIDNFLSNPKLCCFICAHLLGKKLIATPKLQSDDSTDCGKYVVCFFWFSVLTGKSLKDFLKLFNSDFKTNSLNISKIFQTVKKISDSLK